MVGSRLILLLVLVCLSSPVRGEGRYAWPLQFAPALTSTFAEYRSGRFHAGLDIKTWGKVGVPCVAVDDGYVWRVRTSPWGYGKALYLKLKDGSTAVYAHLTSFCPAVEEVVASEQDRRGAYSVDLFLRPDQIAVSRGEVVAHSGSTGSGFPHLHFEIRDENQRPLNPLLNGFAVADSIAPTPVTLAVIPMDAEARIASGARVVMRAIRWDGEGQRFAVDPVLVHGRVGLAIKVHDRADASALMNRLAPYRLRTLVAGREIFRATYAGFSYDHVRQVDLNRNFHLTRAGKKDFHNLFVLPGNDLPLYGPGDKDGVIAAGVPGKTGDTPLPHGDQRVAVVVEDAAGNRAHIHVPLVVTSGIAPASLLEGSTNYRVLSLLPVRFPNHVVLEATTSRPFDALPSVHVNASPWSEVLLADPQTLHIPLDLSSGRDYEVELIGQNDQPAARYRFRPKRMTAKGGVVATGDSAAFAVFAPGQVYDRFMAEVRADSSLPSEAKEGVPIVGTAYRFEPSTVPFRTMAQVHLRYPEDYDGVEKLGVYAWADKGWTFVWNDQDREHGTVWAGVWHFSTYALIRDDEPPLVWGLTPQDGSTVGPDARLSVRLKDELSGIPMEELVAMTLNRQAVVFEYDPEGDVAWGILRAPLLPGDHTLVVRVSDTSGNEATTQSRFTVQLE